MPIDSNLGMNHLPLSPFLKALSYDGFQIGVADYQRINLLLKSDCIWTIIRLRRVLCSLLVNSPEQEEQFVRRFNAFFDTDLKAEISFASIDMDKAISDLEQLRIVSPQNRGGSITIDQRIKPLPLTAREVLSTLCK